MIRISLCALILLLTVPANIFAHVQSGPPYLVVNSEYADTTPIISSGQIVVPQDITTTNILVGTEVIFRVDLSRLTVPPTVAQASKWRWKFDLTDSNFTEGLSVTHRYEKTGSYLVTLQVKDPTSPDFIDYDLVQVNIVPKLDYQLPTASVTATISRDSGVQGVAFSAQVSTDPGTSVGSINWDFGDGSRGEGASVLHTYDKNISSFYPLVRVADRNGVFNDYMLEITSDDRVNNLGSSYQATSSAKPTPTSGWPLAAGGLGVLAVIVIAALKLRRR